MRNTNRRLSGLRSPFAYSQAALVAFVAVLAASSGCGGSGGSHSGSTTNGTPAANAPATTTPATETPAAATPASPDSVALPAGAAGDLGAQVFAKRCVLCHGPDGHGDGVASKGLNPKPRNFHDQAYMSTRTDAQLSEVIHKGKGVMPRWEGQLSEAEIQAVLKHVRALGSGH